MLRATVQYADSGPSAFEGMVIPISQFYEGKISRNVNSPLNCVACGQLQLGQW